MTVLAATDMIPLALAPFSEDWADPNVEDIFVVRPGEYFVRRGGETARREAPGLDALAIESLLTFVAHQRGQYIAEEAPILDAELPGNERINGVVYPCVPYGFPSLALRRGAENMPTLDGLEAQGLFDGLKERLATGAKPDAERRRDEARALLASGQVKELLRACIANRWTTIFSGETASGKAQPLDAKVLTPTGWRLMADLTVGDLVTCPDGRTAPINGVYPQGDKDIWRITFEDGRTVECCDDHLWKVWEWKVRYETGKTHSERKVVNGGAEWSVQPLSRIRSWFEGTGRKGKRAAVPLVEPFAIEMPPRDLTVPPYALGALLGDGTFCGAAVARLSTADAHVLNRVMADLPDYEAKPVEGTVDYRLVQKERRRGGSLHAAVRRLGLADVMAHEKFVPSAYKYGSVTQRLALLQGLMDTDGSVENGTYATLTSTSERLALDVQELAWSLGAVAKIARRQTHYTYKGEKRAGRPSWRVSIVHPDVSRLFTLPRKVAQCRTKGTRDRLRIISIKAIGRKPAQCISVGHPDHLYVTDGFVVTHNTHNTKALLMEIPLTERIVTVANAEELAALPHPNRVSLRYTKGGPVPMEALVEAALRNAPRWLVVPEVRGPEAFSFLWAAATGHPGITSIHAPSAVETFDTFAVNVRQHPAGARLPEQALRSMLRNFVDVVVHVERGSDTRFRVTDIAFGWDLAA